MILINNIAHLLNDADRAGTRDELAAAVTEYVNDIGEQTVIVRSYGDITADPSAAAEAQRVAWDRVLEAVTA